MKTGIVILAAGNSSRLGKPKQLLTYKEKSLIEIVTNAALETNSGPVTIVLGAYHEAILKHLKADFIINDSWSEGMSSSIAAGLSAVLEKFPDLDQVIFAVSDQAHISVAIFNQLIDRKLETAKGIIASHYAETNGTPVLFDKKYFPQLLALKGETGAKPILKGNSNDIETINFENGYIDIDTDTDYQNLIKD